MLRLPVSIYKYDARTKQYHFQYCLQCAVPGAPFPSVMTSSAGQSIVGQNSDLVKAALRTPAVMLCKGARVKIYDSSYEEVSWFAVSEYIQS